jgi:hypothetical protein
MAGQDNQSNQHQSPHSRDCTWYQGNSQAKNREGRLGHFPEKDRFAHVYEQKRGPTE